MDTRVEIRPLSAELGQKGTEQWSLRLYWLRLLAFFVVPSFTELKLWNQFGVRGLPETFFIDHDWKFVSVGAGKEIGNRGVPKVLDAITLQCSRTRSRDCSKERRRGASTWVP